MKLKIRTNGTKQSARRLLEISRVLRDCRMQTEDVCRNLRRHSDLELVRREINKQIDQLQLESGRTAVMADALMYISNLYDMRETQNAQLLEEGRRHQKTRMSAQSIGNLREFIGTVI